MTQIVETIEPQPGPQTAWLGSRADISVYGGQAGGGKTWALLAEAARHIDNKNYGAVIFRRLSTQVTNEGGLWDEAMNIYPKLGGKPIRNTLDWRFDSGANIGFRHLQYDNDKLAWMGSQIPMIGFDELTHFLESQFWYLLSRNRSTCGVKPYIRATCNPINEDDAVGGWVHKLLQWWIDPETGLAIPERSGVVRWFVRVEGELQWGDSQQELYEKFCNTDLPVDHEDQPCQPLSITFVPAKLSDNPAMTKKDPKYRAKLMAMPKVERQQLLEGNWNAEKAGAEWPPEYFHGILTDFWPDAFDVFVAYLDPSKGKTDRSDYSAIVGIGLSGGRMFVDADIRRRPVPQMVSDSFWFCHRNQVAAFGLEANSFQDLLAPEIDRVAKEAGMMPLPIILIENTVNKQVRINRLGPYLARKKFLVKNNEGGKLLVRQMKDFPDGDHDDGPDALEGAVRVLQSVLHRSHAEQNEDEYETAMV